VFECGAPASYEYVAFYASSERWYTTDVAILILNIYIYDVWNRGYGLGRIACFADMAGVSRGWNFIGDVALEAHQEIKIKHLGALPRGV
jgi:hypothetical protein